MSKRGGDKASTSQEYWSYPNAVKALEIAVYYGFSPSTPLSVEKADIELAQPFSTTDTADPHLHAEEAVALLRSLFAKTQPQLPLMIARERKEGQKTRILP